MPFTGFRLTHHSVRRVEQRGDVLWVECTKCLRMKPKKEFSKDSSHLLGIQSQCTSCVNKRAKQKAKAKIQRRLLIAA